jgi:pyruvate dehydrogenase E1 component alpha subunit
MTIASPPVWRAESPLSLPAEELVACYRQMVLARRFEAQTERSFRRGKIGGYLHEYSGQEAVALGFLHALRDDDIFFTAYRDHAHALFCGSDPGRVMAELYGKATGVCKGKGGSMHLFDVPRGFYGGYGIVGNHIPLAVGAAYALRFASSERVCLCFLGDGAMNSGALHESANMAGLWGREGRCPIVFIVENNGYALATSVVRSSAVTDLAARFDAYDIPNERCDGQSLETVHGVARRVIEHVRQTGRPYAVEALTYRFAGHGVADIHSREKLYRSPDEVEQWRRRDPIVLLEQRLTAEGALDDRQIDEIAEWADGVVADAVAFAEESPEPPPEELHRDVYTDLVEAPHG